MVLGHIPLVASGTHNTSVQLRLPFHCFHTPECYQSTAIPIPHYVILQNTVQLCRCPAPSGICLVGEPQLILHVVGNPLCKLGGQPLDILVYLEKNRDIPGYPSLTCGPQRVCTGEAQME